jgi:hexosaminidase
VDAIARHNPLVAEVTQRRRQFQQIAMMGLEAIHAIDKNQLPATGWGEMQQRVLAQAATPMELVDFVILKPMSDLVQATQNNR